METAVLPLNYAPSYGRVFVHAAYPAMAPDGDEPSIKTYVSVHEITQIRIGNGNG